MSKRLLLLFLTIPLLLSALLAPAQAAPTAQDERLVVAYVTGHQETGYNANTFAGFSRLSIVFNLAGATVREISLYAEINSEIDLIVLGGPKQPALSDAEVGRLWNFIDSGGSVLILNDPYPNQGLPASNALNNLLWEDYGIRWREDVLVENWFNAAATLPNSRFGVLNQPERYTGLHAATIPGHALTYLPGRYNLPVYYWHARSLQLQAPALKGAPIALLRTRGPVFGETVVTPEENPRLNYGQDTPPGEIILGAAVENFTTGARIVVMGDSELFKDGYGLNGFAAGVGVPDFAGNELFAKSVAYWLLKQPMEEIPLEQSNLWLAVDGDPLEWAAIEPAYSAEITEQPAITSVQLLRSDRRVYMALDAANVPYPINGLILRSINDRGEAYSFSLQVDGTISASVTSQQGITPVYGIELIMGDIIELSLPLTVLPVGIGYSLTDVCIVSTLPVCATLNADDLSALGAEPRGRNLLTGFATARIGSANGLTLRETINGNVLTQLDPNEFVNVLGRDATGAWVKVWVDGLIGWLDDAFLEYPYDINTYQERDIPAVTQQDIG